MNWMLNRPTMPISRPSLTVSSIISCFTFGLRLKDGYTLMLSPEWMPVRSTCSMMAGMKTFSPSQMASTSVSLPWMYLSTSTGDFSLISTALWR